MSNQKAGLDYFSLYVDIEQDDKIALIQAKYGLEGFAAIIKLFIKIYADKGYYYEWNNKTSLLFAGRLNMEHSKINQIVFDAIEWELFNKEKFQKYQILTSKRIQKMYLEATKRRKKVDILKPFLLLNGEDVDILNENVNIIDENVDILKQSKVKESKVKESKVKESKVNNITPSNVETLPEVDTNKNSFPDEPIEEQKPKKAEKISFDFVGEKWTGLKKEHFTNWLEAYPLIDIDRELVKAKEWVLGNLNKSTRKSNWRQFLNNWFSKAQTFEERKVIYAGSYRK